jgi:hypothetical protein
MKNIFSLEIINKERVPSVANMAMLFVVIAQILQYLNDHTTVK